MLVVLVLPYMSVAAHMRVAVNTTKLQLSRAVGVGHVDERLSSSMSMCTIWVCAKLKPHHQYIVEFVTGTKWHPKAVLDALVF